MDFILNLANSYGVHIWSCILMIAIVYLWKDNQKLRKDARDDTKTERELFIKEIKEEREEAQARADKKDDEHRKENKELINKIGEFTAAVLTQVEKGTEAIREGSAAMKEGNRAIIESAKANFKISSVIEKKGI